MILRLLLVCGLASLILAPTPGATGGCGNADEPAEFASSCTEWRSWDCVRARNRGELRDDYALQVCVDEQDQRCADIGDWPLTCEPVPTNRNVANCVEQLQRADMVDVPFEEIPECDFCP